MNWNDYEAVWRRQEPPVGAGADLSVLRQSFEAKRRKLAATLWVRDIVEASAGLFGAAAFAAIARHQEKIAWPIMIAVALVLGVTGSFVRERIRTHRQKLGPDAPLLAKLEAEIAELRHQRRLLLGVWKWYLVPLTAAIVIVCVTISLNRPPWDLARDPRFMGSYFALVALLMWGVWVINRRAVRRQIEPRIEELEKLHRDLLSLS